MTTDCYLLPAEVAMFPVERLAASAQAGLVVKPGHYALTRADGRATTRLVSAETAELLDLLREPRTLVDAVIRFAEARNSDPATVLELAFPVLGALIADGFLVIAAPEVGGVTDHAAGTEQTTFGSYVAEDVVQRLIDTVVYRGRSAHGEPVAIKVARHPHASTGRTLLCREARVLRRAAGCAVPAVLHDGSGEDPPFLVLEWVPGRRISDYAAAVRRPWQPSARAALLSVGIALLERYAGLHDRGIVHGDVHPKNVLVDDTGQLTILDFALARVPDDPELDTVTRGGVPAFQEPEWALARIAGRRPPPPTTASDQFAVAAVLYHLLTGHSHVETVGGSTQVLHRIAGEEPRPFAHHAVPSWPAVEAVLARMLAKKPEERFPSLADAATELRRTAGAPASGSPADLLGTTVRRLSCDGGVLDQGLPTAPRVSVNYGSDGVAYFFYRLAATRDEPQHLLTASRWLAWSRRNRDGPLAFHDPVLDVRPERVGRVSIYHSPAGTALVETLVANAMGDLRRAGAACAEFVAESRNPCTNLDLTVGRSSTVVGAGLLVEALRGTGIAERANLLDLGDDTLSTVLAGLAHGAGGLRYRGMAHGSAGVLYAALRWHQATRHALSDEVVERLDDLAAAEQRVAGRSTWRGPHDPVMSGWCHGGAGYTMLWAAAARILADHHHADRALRAAEATWAQPSGAPTLCCGLAGQAYAMLAAFQLTGGRVWLRRAGHLATQAVTHVGTKWCLPNSLWKGDVGIAALIEDLARPDAAAMPLFASEGWPG